MAVNPSDFAAAVTSLRESRGWTKKELALRYGRDPAVISRIEAGQQMPDWEDLERLAEALGTSVFRFLRAAGVIDEEPKLREWLATASELLPRHRENLVELYDTYAQRAAELNGDRAG